MTNEQRPPAPRRRRWWWIAGGLVAVVAVIGVCSGSGGADCAAEHSGTGEWSGVLELDAGSYRVVTEGDPLGFLYDRSGRLKPILLSGEPWTGSEGANAGRTLSPIVSDGSADPVVVTTGGLFWAYITDGEPWSVCYEPTG